VKYERRLRAARHQTPTQIEQDDDAPIVRAREKKSSSFVAFSSRKDDDDIRRDHASTRMSFAAPTRIRRPLSALLDAVDARLRDADFKARFRERFSESEEFVQVFRRRERERARDDRGGSAGENRAHRVDDGHARTLLVRASGFFFSHTLTLIKNARARVHRNRTRRLNRFKEAARMSFDWKRAFFRQREHFSFFSLTLEQNFRQKKQERETKRQPTN
jgi:hypothetical protein